MVPTGLGIEELVAGELAKSGKLQIPFFPPYQQIQDFDINRCTGLLQKLAGQNIPFDIRSIRSWRMGTWQASRFRSKRCCCFLIGDAAHQFTPASGFVMNTGIQDAHNLIWKIAMVLRSGKYVKNITAERLLLTYEDERRPVAQMNPFVFNPELRVGGRIPHFWLAGSNGQPFSVLDLPSLMMGVDGDPMYVMLQAGKMMGAELPFDKITDCLSATVHISQSGLPGQANFSYHVKRPDFLPRSFAILIRPDGHIAWCQVDSSLN